MGADAQRTLAKLGGQMIAGGDQTLMDAQRAGAAHAYQLLFVTAGKLSTHSLQIAALDATVVPLTSAKDFLTSSASVFQKLRLPIQASGPPMEMSVAGKSLWRMDLITRVETGTVHSSQIVTIDKGYLLLFTLTAPDQAGLEQLIRTMDSLHFYQDSN